jgi:hypothetical protein
MPRNEFVSFLPTPGQELPLKHPVICQQLYFLREETKIRVGWVDLVLTEFTSSQGSPEAEVGREEWVG